MLSRILILAVKKGLADEVKALIEKNPAALNEIDSRGNTILMIAAGSGSPDVIRYLLNRGADPLRKNDLGFDALGLAEDSGSPEARELIGAWVRNLRHAEETAPGRQMEIPFREKV